MELFSLGGISEARPRAISTDAWIHHIADPIATAAWARAMCDRGVIPLYGTSWRNTASQRVPAKLGLHCSGVSLPIA